MAKKIGNLFRSNDTTSGQKNVGCNQFRDIAAECRVAECYEEILLLIQYSQAKADSDKSWKTICDGNQKAFGETVIDGMEQVKALYGKDPEWREIREPIQLYFGYLYWQSRIRAEQHRSNNQQNGNNQQNSNEHRQDRSGNRNQQNGYRPNNRGGQNNGQQYGRN